MTEAETPDPLGNLLELARTGSRLSPADEDRALVLLKETLLGGKNGIQSAIAPLVTFSWQVGVRAVVDVWPELKPATRTQLLSALSKEESDSGRRMRLSLARGLLPADPALTAKMTAAVCKEIWNNESGALAPADRQMFWNVMIGKGKPWLLHLQIADWKPAEAELLVHCAIAATYTGPPSSLSQETILGWAAKSGCLECLSEAEIALLAAGISRWPEKLRRNLRRDSAGFPAALLSAIENSLPPAPSQPSLESPAPDSPEAAQDKTGPREPEREKRPPRPERTRGGGREQAPRAPAIPDSNAEADGRIDVPRMLRQLEACFIQLRNELSQAKAKLLQREREPSKGRRGRYGRGETEAPLELAGAENPEELRRHNAQLENTVAELRQQLEDLAGHHEDVAESMQAHGENPATDAQDQFRKLLAIKLKKEFADFQALDKEPPDEVLREHYRLILQDVFGILQAQGVPLEAGEKEKS